jgi:hypothetical protein
VDHRSHYGAKINKKSETSNGTNNKLFNGIRRTTRKQHSARKARLFRTKSDQNEHLGRHKNVTDQLTARFICTDGDDPKRSL